MKLIKKLLGIKTTYAIPSDNGVDITKGKKYKFNKITDTFGTIKDDANTKLYIFTDSCEHINYGNWESIIE